MKDYVNTMWTAHENSYVYMEVISTPSVRIKLLWDIALKFCQFPGIKIR